MYAKVIVDISASSVDRIFEYRIPARLEADVRIGSCVHVPFGQGNRQRSAYVVEICGDPEFDPHKIKDISSCDEGALGVQSQLIVLAKWIRENYGGTMNQALKTVLPVKQKIRPQEKKTILCLLDQDALEAAIREAERKKYRARLRLLTEFRLARAIPLEIARTQLHISDSSLEPLLEDGTIRMEKETVTRGSCGAGQDTGKKPVLNEEQALAVSDFRAEYDAGIRGTRLICGVTGSGKTEVYMELMDHVLSQGKQVILLIPEISLTYQTVMRFYRRFGDRIAILNSRLSAGERYDQWMRAQKGEVSIMIGPRSALFAPFDRLGLIIIDEEHENAYKSENVPRYHARETAEARARLSGACVVLGSATPSMESFFRTESGKYSLSRLTGRAVPGSVLPQTEIVDMREELAGGNRSIFSRTLHRHIETALKSGEQVMLFINRRGYAGFISCRSCGKPLHCPHCDVSLTLHGKNRLVCHYCGYETVLPKSCPTCGSRYLAGFGTGTQKLAWMTAQEFPNARILRMDADTTRKKGSLEEILEQFSAREADILIGTQMIVKGHDFPAVTVMGIMAADMSLNTPDYRSSERTFSLITQAAGRAGRAEKPGHVVIQTYMPDHYAVRTAAAQDYDAFYREEIAYRRISGYPPVCAMMEIRFQSPDEAAVNRMAEGTAELLRRGVEKSLESVAKRGENPADYGIEIIGPADAPVYRVKDVYRKMLYIKGMKYDILLRIRNYALKMAQKLPDAGKVAVSCDTDV